ncbi:MAG: tyrosine-type recombinase/integrase [Clostridia bacterium]|nr:tyrosine-type recombinase/integrase [Clostridia bacterium]
MLNLSFDWQISEYMIFCHSQQLRKKTMNSYEQTLRLFERWCVEQMDIETVDKVSEGIIRRYINDLQERGKYTFCCDDKSITKNYPNRRRDFRNPISVCTINNYIRNLRAFFNWLDVECVINKSPMKKIRQLKQERKPKEYLNDEEFKKLISCLDKSYFSEHRDFAMIMLMIDSGMRLGECSCLLVTDIDLARQQVYLRAEITKGRHNRTVYFSEKTERVLRRWLQFKDRYVESDYMFPVKSSGNHIDVSPFETNFRRYVERAGLSKEYTPHCLRNNFAKRCLMNGMDLYTLSRILGHSSAQVTEQAYLDLTDEDLGEYGGEVEHLGRCELNTSVAVN